MADNTEQRKNYLRFLVTESIKILKEQAPPAPQVSAVPPGPSPAPPVAGVPQAGTEPPAGGPEGAKPFTVDELIERLNVVRSGKSFSDPEVYGHLTTFFKGLSDADKATVDRFLQGLAKVVVQVEPGQEGQQAGTSPPPPPPPPPGGAGGAPPAAPAGPMG